MFSLFKKLVVTKPQTLSVFEPVTMNVYKEHRRKLKEEDKKAFSITVDREYFKKLKSIHCPSTYQSNRSLTQGGPKIKFLIDLYLEQAKLGKGNYKIRKFANVERTGPEEVNLVQSD